MTLRSTGVPCWKSTVVSISWSPGLRPFVPISITWRDFWWLIMCTTLTESAAAWLGAADADAIDMAAMVPASSATVAPMTANTRTAPPYLYRTCRLVQIGGSHVQHSAPSHHSTLHSNGLIHAQCKEHFTPALPGFPHPTAVNPDRERLTKGQARYQLY